MPQRSILVIDDEAETVDLVEAAFQRRGYKVIGAWSGPVGLQLARECRPAVILIDIMLPEMNGFEVCRALQRDPNTACIPRIVLSARASLADQSDAATAGADRYLMKPIGIKVLVSVVEGLMLQACMTGKM